MRQDDDIFPPVVVSWKSIRRVLAVVVPLLLILVALIAWLSRWPRYEIAADEIALPSVREIRCRRNDPHALEVHVSGEINGVATFVTPYGTYSLRPGAVDLKTGGEYYEDKAAKLKYIPENVTEGYLVVKYQFHTIGGI